MKRWFAVLPVVGALFAAASFVLTNAQSPAPALKYRVVAPGLSRAEAVPTSTPVAKPIPYNGPVASLHLGSANISGQWPVETRDTTVVGGRETFQDPTRPERIAWYARFGQPGYPGNNSIFAAHINYIDFGNGPFAYLTTAVAGDALYVTMANGDSYAYTVQSVDVVPLAALESGAMDAYVFPALDAHTERITLISCGGEFDARPGGGGDYTSRVILVAQRYVD